MASNTVSSEQQIPTPSSSVSEDDTDDKPDEMNYLFNVVYYKWIIEFVKFSQVIPKLPFMRPIAGQIYTLDNEGKTKEAGNVFMNKLKEVDEPGKYRSLLYALQDLEYTTLANAIEHGEDITVNRYHEQHKKILDIFTEPLMDKINPGIMSNMLLEKGIISSDDMDTIMKTEMNKSTQWATFLLLDAIPRRAENWYSVFWHILFDFGHRRLCQEIDPKLYDAKMKELSQTEGAQAGAEDSFAVTAVDTTEECESGSSIAHVPVRHASSYTLVEEDSSSPNKCNCSCAQAIDKKCEELKALFEMMMNNLELKFNEQQKLLAELSRSIGDGP